ncbi:hypothetical protein Tco_1554017 [Tanacetum coccineum]
MGDFGTDIQEKDKKKAKNKQNRARSGKDQVKSKSKVIHMKKIQLEGLKLPNLKLYYNEKKTRIEMQTGEVFAIRGKNQRVKSINEGPFHMGTVSDVITGGTEGAVQQGPVRARVLNDLSAEEKERYKADIRATNILLQGIPKDIYSLINHYTDAKDIWENVKMILEGSELTKDDRESQLYDEFEHFCQNKGETIQGY